MKKTGLLAVLLVFCLLCGCGSKAVTENTMTAAKGDEPAKEQEQSGEQEQPAQEEEDAVITKAYADIVVKDYGTITVELDGTAAPITVKNFVTFGIDNCTLFI